MAVDMNMKVLVVDDYKTMRTIVGNLLRQLGFKNVEEASDGGSALDFLRREKFGMIISDWNMEPMSGIDLLREVRKDEHLKGLPFIMVTAESKVENVQIAVAAGVNNYIVKPFNADTLKAKIEKVLGPLPPKT